MYSFFYLAQRLSQNVSFTIAPSVVMVGRLVGKNKKQKQKQKQKKETKNQHLKGSGFQRSPGC